MNKKTLVLTVLMTVLGGALGTYAVNRLMGTGSPPSYDIVLMQTSNEMNKTLPRLVDKDTQLDATMSGPGLSLTYVYTLVNYRKADLNVQKLKSSLEPQIIANYKTHDDMKQFREKNVELHYQYKDKDGVFLLEIVTSPKDF